MTKAQRDFVEYDRNYKALYDIMIMKGYTVEVDPKAESFIVQFDHFHIELCTSSNENKIYIRNHWDKEAPTIEGHHTGPRAFRYFSNYNVMQYLSKIEALETFINQTEG